MLPKPPPRAAVLLGCDMTLETRSTKQDVRKIWLSDVAKYHGWNMLLARVAVLVVPSAPLHGESNGIKRTSVVWHQYSMSTLNWIPPAATSASLHLRNDWLRLGSVGNKCRKTVASWNAAGHPAICEKLR
jgi:hypothetical protein